MTQPLDEQQERQQQDLRDQLMEAARYIEVIDAPPSASSTPDELWQPRHDTISVASVRDVLLRVLQAGCGAAMTGGSPCGKAPVCFYPGLRDGIIPADFGLVYQVASGVWLANRLEEGQEGGPWHPATPYIVALCQEHGPDGRGGVSVGRLMKDLSGEEIVRRMRECARYLSNFGIKMSLE